MHQDGHRVGLSYGDAHPYTVSIVLTVKCLKTLQHKVQ